MSRIVDFYSGQRRDAAGRTLAEIWAWDDAELEDVHDFIQWLFPLPERSHFNADAPRLTPADMTAFRKNEQLQHNLARSFQRILAFFGLEEAEDGSIREGANFDDRAADIWEHPNHNWLRITRILRSLSLLGQRSRALAFQALLESFITSRRFPVSAQTATYWREATSVPDELQPGDD